MGFQTGIPCENASTVLDSNGTFYPYTVNTFGAWIQIRSIPKNTLAETNIFASENGWLEDDFPIGKMIFYWEGICSGAMLFLGRVSFHVPPKMWHGLKHIYLLEWSYHVSTTNPWDWYIYSHVVDVSNDSR